MSKPTSYHCYCGWSRIILDGETIEDAKRIHQGLPIHEIAMRDKRKAQENDFLDAHYEGLHDETSREGCPECDSQPRRR